MGMKTKARLCMAVSVVALTLGGVVPAKAEDAATLKALQEQINALQKQLTILQAAQAKSEKAAVVRAAAPVPVASAAGEAKGSDLHGVIKAKTGVDLTLGGFIDVTGVFRTKNESADVTSNLNTMIPFNNAANAHENEFRASARTTRLSLLATGNPDADTKLTGYVEVDFLGSGSNSTTTQTSGYVPRLRHAFGEYENNAWGLHLLGGQSWSLVTMSKVGMNPLDGNIPNVVDSAYIPGFNFTRAPQIRVMKDFDDKRLWVGISAEAPQAEANGVCVSSSPLGNSPSTATDACTGFPSTTQITSTGYTAGYAGSQSTDIAPDIIGKVSYDAGWAHVEAFGVMRFFHNMVGTNAHNNYYVSGGGGAAAIVPIIPKKLSVQANFMAGQGIGRYSAAQLPDFSVTPTGSLKPLEEYTAMFGIVGKPTPSTDAYLYAGLEQVFRHSVNGQTKNVYGYGNFGVDNTGCNTIGGSCYAQTSSVWQISPGVWQRIYGGNYGKLQVGLQHSWTRRNAFSDSSGVNPHAIENITMVSFRYAPF